jgi:CubicO group peptidase (beta-lactamase class C family)
MIGFRNSVMAAIVLIAPILLKAQETGPIPLDRVYKSELRFSIEDEATYRKRFALSQNRSTNAQLYEIMETIPGAARPVPLPTAAPANRTISESALRAANAYAERNNSSALLVWRNGKLESETYFGGATRASLQNSFSIAKPLTALAVGRAIKLGKIKSLDQKVADFIPEWRDDPLRSRIEVRHLLDMRSGLLRQANASDADDVMARSFVHPRSDDILIKEYPVTHLPGSRYEYNNAASAIVAILIERATGRRYSEFVGSEVLAKIGAPGGEGWLNREQGLMNSGCCMMLSAETYLRMALLTLKEGVWNGQRLLPTGYVAAMIKGTEQNPRYGLGVYPAGTYIARRGWANADAPLPKVLHSEPYLAADLYLFDGNMNQVAYVVPSQNLAILRIGGSPPRSEGSEWDNSYLPNVILRGIEKDRGQSVPQPR